MRKISLIFLCLATLFVTLTFTVAADTELSVGPDEQFQSISSALNAIPENAGNTTLLITGNLDHPDDSIVSVPTDRNILSLSIECAPHLAEGKIPSVGYLFANGIPFTLGENVSMENAWIFGGMQADNGRIRQVSQTNLTIRGSAGYVFGGGAAFSGGTSIVKSQSVVLLTETGKVYWEIFGGGFASGEKSHATTETTKVQLFGVTDYGLAGGLAQDGGTAAVTALSEILVEASGDIRIALFGGGSAVGANSTYQSQDTKVTISGHAGWAFGGDFVYQGGKSFLNGLAEITLTNAGHVKALYGGSFATDTGSQASFNRARILNAGTAESVTPDGEQSNGGTVFGPLRPD